VERQIRDRFHVSDDLDIDGGGVGH